MMKKTKNPPRGMCMGAVLLPPKGELIKNKAKSQASLVEAWKYVPNGTEVVVRKDDGQEYLTRISAGPVLLGGHTAVIRLEGIRGCYSLARVRKATEADGALPKVRP